MTMSFISSVLSPDFHRLMNGDFSTSFTKKSLVAFGARAAIRPVLLIFFSPSRLTPLLKQNASISIADRSGTFGPFQSYQNAFIPFETSKYQFVCLLSFARLLSAIYRSASAVSAQSEQELRDVNAVALGDILGDTLEVFLYYKRYGGNLRFTLMQNLLFASVYLRILLLNKSNEDFGKFGVLLQQFDITAIFTNLLLWYLMTNQQNKAKLSAYASVSLLLLHNLPSLVSFGHALFSRMQNQSSFSLDDRAEQKFVLSSSLLTLVALLLKTRRILGLTN